MGKNIITAFFFFVMPTEDWKKGEHRNLKHSRAEKKENISQKKEGEIFQTRTDITSTFPSSLKEPLLTQLPTVQISKACLIPPGCLMFSGL